MSVAGIIAAAAAFNLICSGTQMTNTGQPGSVEQEPFTVVYRIDLEERRWCIAGCTETQLLQSVGETEIVFKRRETQTGDFFDMSVNRESGDYVSLIKFGSRNVIRTGNCKRAPFTGFPSRKF